MKNLGKQPLIKQQHLATTPYSCSTEQQADENVKGESRRKKVLQYGATAKRMAWTGVLAASLMVLPGVFAGTPALAQQKTERDSLTYGELLQKTERGEVKRVELDETEQIAKVYLKEQKRDTRPLQVRLLNQNTELINKLKAKNVDFGEVSSANSRDCCWAFDQLDVDFAIGSFNAIVPASLYQCF